MDEDLLLQTTINQNSNPSINDYQQDNTNTPVVSNLIKKIKKLEDSNRHYKECLILFFIINYFIFIFIFAKMYYMTNEYKNLNETNKKKYTSLEYTVNKMKESNSIFSKIILYEFNEKYNLDLRLNDSIIMLNRINDEALEIFGKILFENLTELQIYGGEANIKNIDFLTNSQFNNLESLTIRKTEINDINILAEAKMMKLKELTLIENKIENINIFEQLRTSGIEILDVYSNNIKDISVLKKINLSKLKELNLSDNKIDNINVFENKNYPLLEILNIGNNQIKDISVLSKVKLDKLKKIVLTNNQIYDITELTKTNFTKWIEQLYLSGNQIKDIGVLADINFEKMFKLDLSYNPIENIDSIFNCKFNELISLYLVGVVGKKENRTNFVEKIKSSNNFPKLKNLYLKNYARNELDE